MYYFIKKYLLNKKFAFISPCILQFYQSPTLKTYSLQIRTILSLNFDFELLDGFNFSMSLSSRDFLL